MAMASENVVEMHVVPKYYYLLKSGEKSVEGRLCHGEALPVKVGTTIRMSTDKEMGQLPLNLLVTRIAHYPSFAEIFIFSLSGVVAQISDTICNTAIQYLTAEGLPKCLPGCSSLDDGVAVYRTFYTEEQEKQHGVLAFQVSVL